MQPKNIPKSNPVDDKIIPINWRKIVLNRKAGVGSPNIPDAEIHSIINRTLYAAQVPAHIRIQKVRRNYQDTLTVTTTPKCSGNMVLKYKDMIISVTRKADPDIIDLTTNKTWQRVKLHGVLLSRYFTRDSSGLDKLRSELEAENDGMKIPLAVRWLARTEIIYQRWSNKQIDSSSVTFAVKGEGFVEKMIRDGVRVCGRWMRVTQYVQVGPGALCTACSAWGHIEERCAFLSMARCVWCSGLHRTKFQKCDVAGCTRPQGTPCQHMTFRCPNCKGPHSAISKECPAKRSAMEAVMKSREENNFGEEMEEWRNYERENLNKVED